MLFVSARDRARQETGGVWSAAVLDDLPGPRLAHAPEWFTAIQQAYGHQPLYLTATSAEGHVGVLPAFVVRRPITGPIVTSMPFLDSGGPCCASPDLAAALLEQLLTVSRRIGARTVDIRSAQRLPLPVPPSARKVNLQLALPADPDALWRRLDGGVRNQVRKAQRSGLAVETHGADALPDFYRVFAARMRDLGSPVHAPGFFRAVLDAFGARARIVLVRSEGMPIGALLAIAFRDQLAVPWAACRTPYLRLCPNMLMYWETLRAACVEGFRFFDFGRSTRGSGTYRFKRQWGAVDEPLFWYTIRPETGVDAASAAPPRGDARTGTDWAAIATGVWRHLPVPVTTRLGPGIRRFLIQ